MSNYLNARHGIEIWHYDGKTQIIGGAVDPTVEGVEANIGSLYLHTNGSHYKKIGSNNTEWVLLIEESPQDDGIYARKNGQWVNIGNGYVEIM